MDEETSGGAANFCRPAAPFWRAERASVEGGDIPPSLSCLGISLWYKIRPTFYAAHVIRHLAALQQPAHITAFFSV